MPAAAAQAPVLVALRGVGKTFLNGTHALAHLDLEVRAGEFLTLLGPSGCGKSTALRLIAGLEKPSAGAILSHLPHKPGNIGFVFQDATLMPWASVRGNVRLPLELQHMHGREAEQRVD